MVCNRCIRIVKEELEKLHLLVETITLGEVVISGEHIDLEKIQVVLQKNGFELLDNKQATIVESVKILIIKILHDASENSPIEIHYPTLIEKKIGYNYHYISQLFSSIENMTIEKYIILQKIERVKELLVYGERTLNEIAYKLGYSSVQHLSNQFKQITGLTPKHFKTIKGEKRISLDVVGKLS